MILSILSGVARPLRVRELQKFAVRPRPSWLPDGFEAEMADVKIHLSSRAIKSRLLDMAADGLVERLVAEHGHRWTIATGGQCLLDEGRASSHTCAYPDDQERHIFRTTEVGVLSRSGDILQRKFFDIPMAERVPFEQASGAFSRYLGDAERFYIRVHYDDGCVRNFEAGL